jgi:triosephosphate isomerase
MEAPQRKMIIGGNWKCNGTLQSIKELVSNVLNKAEFDANKVEVVVAPISIHIASVKALLNENVQVACQNMSATPNGAFTGEISGEQLKDFDVQWVLIGHSERRVKYGETNETIATKVARAQEIGLNTIVCMGESLEQREAGETNAHLQSQLEAFKSSVTDWNKVVLAYEPIWAIGTGKTATPEIAEAAHAFIRQWMTQNVSEEVSNSVRI